MSGPRQIVLQRFLLLRAPRALLTICPLFACSADASRLTVRAAEHRDTSPALEWMVAGAVEVPDPECPAGGECLAPDSENLASEAGSGDTQTTGSVQDSPMQRVEQRAHGRRPPLPVLESFDGLGVGFTGTNPPALRNPSDNSLAVGPDHIVQTVNSRLAVFTKRGARFDTTGVVLYGAIATNIVFSGFGGACEQRLSGDAVVRYDQLANRWLFVLPIFSRPPGQPNGDFSMCYAVSEGSDPLGRYHRYEYRRPLFPDYPRPAIWRDGYYVSTSTGDDVIQKHACVAERDSMLVGAPAREQCLIIDGVNFLNNADIDGYALPPKGAPNPMLAAGGTQLKGDVDDDGLYAWKFHVDWADTSRTRVTGPVKLPVAPYAYMCGGQLTNCVPQSGTDRRLDSQGDKIMTRLTYRNVDGRESMVAQHSVNTTSGQGGVRWYELTIGASRELTVAQQGTFAPDTAWRWMASGAMDRVGNIVFGYSYGSAREYPGQRLAGRVSTDPPGTLGFHETQVVRGEGAQRSTLRWQDYTMMAMDPDDCRFWYVGDYFKEGATAYSTRIAATRVAGC
ncbi:MAG: hypothetical protein H7066_07705 [Cytophagaceae bacterium]|nr:hypothetical protein [Gemmatimonadaceae bacterium]